LLGYLVYRFYWLFIGLGGHESGQFYY
jgi:hypothetical protein